MNAADREKTCLPILRDTPLFRDLGEEPLRHLAGGCARRTVARGRMVCEAGAVLDGLFVLIEGRVKLAILSAEGAERVIDIVLPGGVFGESASFLDEPSPVYAEALCDCSVLSVSRERLREAVERWPAVAMVLLTRIARNVRDLTRDLEACCLLSAGQRVARFLLNEAACGPGTTDQAEVSLPAAKVVVASSLNLTPETFSRELHVLVRDGLIEVGHRSIRVHSLARLRGRCGAG
jgi:CRP/FNR family transcriptional regulator, dissimilatory nitrate respiration regulator